jgi:hypothetical protein
MVIAPAGRNSKSIHDRLALNRIISRAPAQKQLSATGPFYTRQNGGNEA